MSQKFYAHYKDNKLRKPSQRYVAIDVETTGLSPRRGHRIIEIGAIAIEGISIVAEFSSLIQADRKISLDAQLVHGITDEMLFGKPSFEDIFPDFHAFIEGSTLIAHNAGFDIGFLRHEYSRIKHIFQHQYFCTMELSRRRLPRLRDHKLETVYRHLCSGKVTGRQRHRALGDAHMVAAIWLAMEGR